MIQTDLVVVGGGIAGLRAAIAAAEADLNVVLISRAGPSAHHDGNIRDGLNAPGDQSLANQFEADTNAAGEGLADPQTVTESAAAAVAEVVAVEHMGTAFTRSSDGGLQAFAQGRNGAAYSMQAGWWTGRALLNALHDQAAAYAFDCYFEWLPLQLLVDDDGVCGLTALNIRSGQAQVFAAGNVLLTEGAVGGLFAVSGNPRHSVGTAQALATAAGAPLLDPELIEFLPGVLSQSPSSNGVVIGDAAAAAGATYTGLAADPSGLSLGAWARALDPAGGSRVEFSGCAEAMELFGPELEPILDADLGANVIPSAHYSLGGVAPETGIAGLHVAGEAAAGGLHGAGLLPGNALLDLLLSPLRALARVEPRPAMLPESARWRAQEEIQLTMAGDSGIDSSVLWTRLRDLVGGSLGQVREGSDLAAAAAAIAEIGELAGRAAPAGPGYHFNLDLVRLLELRQGARTAAAMAAGAAARCESRGPHQRLDFPAPADPPAEHSAVFAAGSGWRTERWAGYRAGAEVTA